MLEKIEEVLLKEKPDYVMVYGDTNSTLAGALAAKKLHIKVVHVEAGLRSFNMRMPEEINRILSDRISNILCCPTENAVENLIREGFDHFACTLAKTGDVMQDAAIFYSKLSDKKSTIINKLELKGVNFVLCTIHRAENTDDPDRLDTIVAALNKISQEMRIILPLHPRTRKILQSSRCALKFEPIEPVGYFDMIELMKCTRLVMTDSGGVQKEAFFFKKPCITLRDETEWVELLQYKYNTIAGSNTADIYAKFHEMSQSQMDYEKNLYGNGNASINILDVIIADNKSTISKLNCIK